jgi:hypothetical protein
MHKGQGKGGESESSSHDDTAGGRVIPFEQKRKCLQCGTPRAKHAKHDGFCTYECSVKWQVENETTAVALSIRNDRGGNN